MISESSYNNFGFEMPTCIKLKKKNKIVKLTTPDFLVQYAFKNEYSLSRYISISSIYSTEVEQEASNIVFLYIYYGVFGWACGITLSSYILTEPKVLANNLRFISCEMSNYLL